MNLLHTIGLMTRAEHERIVRGLESQLVLRESAFEAIEGERDRLNDKFKEAVTDLEKQAHELADLKRDYAHRGELLTDARAERETAEAEAKSLRPDAEAMRKKRAADRKRMAGKRGKA